MWDVQRERCVDAVVRTIGAGDRDILVLGHEGLRRWSVSRGWYPVQTWDRVGSDQQQRWCLQLLLPPPDQDRCRTRDIGFLDQPALWIDRKPLRGPILS